MGLAFLAWVGGAPVDANTGLPNSPGVGPGTGRLIIIDILSFGDGGGFSDFDVTLTGIQMPARTQFTAANLDGLPGDEIISLTQTDGDDLDGFPPDNPLPTGPGLLSACSIKNYLGPGLATCDPIGVPSVIVPPNPQGRFALSMGAGDLDGDHHPEVVVGWGTFTNDDDTGQLDIFGLTDPNNPSSFALRATQTTGQPFSRLAVGDMRGDYKAELVQTLGPVAGDTTDKIRVLSGLSADAKSFAFSADVADPNLPDGPAGQTGGVFPIIEPAAAVAIAPPQNDANCDGFDNDGNGQVDEAPGACLLRFFFAPVCFDGTDAQFKQTVDDQLSHFIDSLQLNLCASNVGIDILFPSQFSSKIGAPCDSKDGDGNPCVDAVGLKKYFIGLGVYDPLKFTGGAAFTDRDLCGTEAGETSPGDFFLWAESSATVAFAHETGHQAGLNDEYCATAANGVQQCNHPGDINSLDPALGCDPASSSCCNVSFRNPADGPSPDGQACSVVDTGGSASPGYIRCCLGNLARDPATGTTNTQGGRCNM